MANTPVFFDLIRDRLLAIPLVIEKGFTKKTLYRQFLSQLKPGTVKYPCMTIAYDRDRREPWTIIDSLQFFVTIHMDVFEDLMLVADAVVDSLDQFMDTSTCVTVYKIWLQGGPTAPIYNAETNRWEAVIEFSALTR